MTKKILALALAGTTAFSVFASAMSVNAVDTDRSISVSSAITADDDAYDKTADYKAVVTDWTVSGYDGTDAIIADGWKDTIIRDHNGDTNPHFLIDYAANNDTSEATYDAIVDALEAGTTANIKKALYDYYNDGTQSGDLTVETAAYGASSGTRRDVIDEFNKVFKLAEDFDPDIYDIQDLREYNLWTTSETGAGPYVYKVAGTTTGGTLIGDILAITNTATAETSEMLYLVQEYNRLIGDELVSTSTSYEQKYYDMLDGLSLVESDYTEANWKRIEAYLLDAEKDADKGTEAGYKDAIADLSKVSTIKTIAPDYAALKSALEDLFEDGKIPTTQPKTDAEDITPYGGNIANHTYQISDYTVNRKVADEWYDFAGYRMDSTRDDYVEGAYRKAMEVYANCRVSTSRAYVGQSIVDSAVAALEDAIAAMDPSYDAANWKITYLQEMIDKAQSLDENDYKTASSAYKDFVKKLEAAETVLNATTVNPTNAFTKADALEKAINKLNTVQKNVPATTKTEAKNLRKEANNLYKNVDGKTDTQIQALKDAIEAYDVLDSTATISEYADVIDALNAAIANYSQPQGWYTTTDGKYMYGEGDGYYVDGWKKIGNFWFYFNADGTAKQNEWFQDGGNWYYCGNSCVAYSGWGKVDGSWYYFSKSNVMCTGWVRPANSYYYLDPTSGKMVTGWAQIGGKWYYFSTDANTLGAMLVSTTTPDGYQVGADGAMI